MGKEERGGGGGGGIWLYVVCMYICNFVCKYVCSLCLLDHIGPNFQGLLFW